MISRPSCKTLSLLTALLLAGATAHAQQQGAGMGMQQQAPQTIQQPVPGQPGAPGTPATPGLPTDQASPRAYADQAFVSDTFKNNQAQVQLSELAQQKSSSPDVKQFSQQMVKVHTELTTQLEPLAKRLDVSMPKKPSRKEKREMDKLQTLSGQDFDAAYLQAMAKEQEHSLKSFKNEEAAQNPVLQKIAKVDMPVLTQHFQVLEKLAQKYNVTIADTTH